MRLTWAFFPYAVALVLAGVAVVDGGIIWTAFSTFPGRVTHSQFEDSNRHHAVQENAARDAALGWNTELSLVAGMPRLLLTDRNGQKVEGARVVGQASRPLGNSTPIELVFRAAAPGDYVAETRLPDAGQWQIDLIAAASGKRIHLSRWVVLP